LIYHSKDYEKGSDSLRIPGHEDKLPIFKLKLILMDNLIKIHDWIMEEQNFLKVNNKWLSIVPEYSYKYRDADNKIIVSRTPVGTKLNCALQEGQEYVEFNEFYDEGEFLNYLSKL